LQYPHWTFKVQLLTVKRGDLVRRYDSSKYTAPIERQQWEYIILRLGAETTADIEVVLNDFGSAEWELVSVARGGIEMGDAILVAYMKRRRGAGKPESLPF